MKKFLTILALTGLTTVYSQITINSGFPSVMGAGSTVDADVKIIKGAVGNFAKYQLDVPAGYVISAVEVKGGNFTFENQRAKIVWVSVPSESEFTVKFKVQALTDAISPATFTQKFYYLENNEKKEIEASPVFVTIGNPGTVAIYNTPTETKPATTSTPVETTPVTTTPTETKPVTTTNTPVETKPVTPPTPVESKPTTSSETKPVATKPTATTSNEAGLTFKVQIGAYSSEPNKSKFSGAGKVSVDLINGMYKVTTGNFKTKEEAIKFRDELQSKGFSNCFIAKYKDGVRIN